MDSQILTVTEANALINQTLEYAYPEIVVEGEISGYKVNQNKWVFFNIKDAGSTLGCFMSVYQLKTPLEDGMLVRLHATPKLTQWGKFSLTVRSVELAGEGSVKKAFELLKSQLQKEGIFARGRKRILPKYPHCIALITSRQAAAYNDFVTILDDRWGGLQVDHMQVQVQGESAPEQIRSAIERFNLNSDTYDVLVLIRGGGSADDLQAFNTEEVVRAVFGSTIPTIVGIGHEDDVCLAELAADVRAATPTDAARLLVPDRREVLSAIIETNNLWYHKVTQLVQSASSVVESFELSFAHFASSLGSSIERYDSRMAIATHYIVLRTREHFRSIETLLHSLDPQAVLARGYAIVRLANTSLTQANQVAVGDDIVIQLHQGKIGAKVTRKDT